MTAASIRLARTAAVSGTFDLLLATGFLAVGALIVYLVLFDQGAAAAVLFGSTAGNGNVLHELFHDGRHLSGAPCH
jgi:Probable cobalt transporter subunit (CbtB)